LISAHEHAKAINDIQMYKDYTMFVTASKDNTAKVSKRHFICHIFTSDFAQKQKIEILK